MKEIVGMFVLVVVILFLGSLLLAWPFMWMWNYAMVNAVIITKPIEYWTAFWLFLFISFFFVGFNSSSEK